MSIALLIVCLLAAPASAIAGSLAGAYIYHRGRTGGSPVPSLGKIAEAFKRERKGEQQEERPQRKLRA